MTLLRKICSERKRNPSKVREANTQRQGEGKSFSERMEEVSMKYGIYTGTQSFRKVCMEKASMQYGCHELFVVIFDQVLPLSRSWNPQICCF